MAITPIQKMIIEDSQRGLDNLTSIPNVIMGSFNSLTSTAIYHYGDYRLWYRPMQSVWVVWRNEEFCFSFERSTKVIDMIARMDNKLSNKKGLK